MASEMIPREMANDIRKMSGISEMDRDWKISAGMTEVVEEYQKLYGRVRMTAHPGPIGWELLPLLRIITDLKEKVQALEQLIDGLTKPSPAVKPAPVAAKKE